MEPPLCLLAPVGHFFGAVYISMARHGARHAKWWVFALATVQWHGMGRKTCTDAAKALTHTVRWPKACFAIHNSMHLVSSQSTHIKTSIPAQITTSQSCRQFRCHIAHQNNHCLNCLQMMTSHPLRNVCGTCCCRSCRQETQSARKGPSPGPYK